MNVSRRKERIIKNRTKKTSFILSRGASATLIKEGEKISCLTGDAMFMAAREDHHFEEISDDFATWVIFF